MNKTKVKKQKTKEGQVMVSPTYNPDAVITHRSYGIIDLKKYINKIRNNIKIFEEAIGKERSEMKKTQGMIDVLEKDIKEAKMFKKLKKQKN